MKQHSVCIGVTTLLLLPAFACLRSNSRQQHHAKPEPQSTFYRDVLPILQGHCQGCHRTGGIAPTAFENYESTRPYAAAIRMAVEQRTMPPWFAEPGIGKFSNDPSLNTQEIATLAAWADA